MDILFYRDVVVSAASISASVALKFLSQNVDGVRHQLTRVLVIA